MKRGRSKERLGRLDLRGEHREAILPLCRLSHGDIWEDTARGHRVGVLDATEEEDVRKMFKGQGSGAHKARAVINDPPYNVAVGGVNTANLSKTGLEAYMEFSEGWVRNALDVLDTDSHLYIWIGADYRDGFQPLPDLILLLRRFSSLKTRNWITLRNQRGYGTQKNWMWVRQELLHYTRGEPGFKVLYTDIPKILKGYHKVVGGRLTENLERSRSRTIRPGNVWVDIQQVFYRMEENVPGCYAQKPLRSIERIVRSSSTKGDLVADFFSHSGTTLLAGEIHGRRVFTFDLDPVFAEITIRRLERYRDTGKTGWQWACPFPELEPEP